MFDLQTVNAAGNVLSGIGSAVSGIFGGSDDAKQIARRNRKFQEYMAKHQIRWRQADAKAAGLHPLFAMGVSPQSFSPTSIPGQSSTGDRVGQAFDGIGRAFSGYARGKQAEQLQDLQVQESLARIKLLEAQAKATDPVTAAAGASVAKRIDQMANQARPNPKPPTKYYVEPFTHRRVALPPSSPTEVIEEEAGEPASWAYGILRLLELWGGDWNPELQNTKWHARGRKVPKRERLKRKYGRNYGRIERK